MSQLFVHADEIPNESAVYVTFESAIVLKSDICQRYLNELIYINIVKLNLKYYVHKCTTP